MLELYWPLNELKDKLAAQRHAAKVGRRVREAFFGKPFVEIDCKLLSVENHKSILFGVAGKLTYFEHQPPSQARGKLSQAVGGILFLNGIEALSGHIQRTISQILEERQMTVPTSKPHAIRAFVFSSQSSMQDLRAVPDMGLTFLENLLGVQILLPSLPQRGDFKKITLELLRQTSPTHRISKAALDALETRDWPGNIRQLKKVLRILVASAEGPIIRNANVEPDHSLSGSEITPCEICTQSHMRKETFLLIKKTWLETGGNISLPLRRFGISRTTVYKHVKKLSQS